MGRRCVNRLSVWTMHRESLWKSGRLRRSDSAKIKSSSAPSINRNPQKCCWIVDCVSGTDGNQVGQMERFDWANGSTAVSALLQLVTGAAESIIPPLMNVPSRWLRVACHRFPFKLSSLKTWTRYSNLIHLNIQLAVLTNVIRCVTF